MIDKKSQLDGPFCVLPAEIITDIFKQAICVDTHSLDHDEKDHLLLADITTPLALGAVCRSWRSFVWETPSLWTIIVLSLSEEREDAQTDTLHLWLKKSKSYPLDIWVGDINDSEQHAIRVLQILVDESWRWRKLNTIVSDNLLDVLGQVHRKVPQLQSCYLHCVYYDMPPDLHPRIGMFEDAPLLSRFTYSCNGRQRLGDLTLPWAQLTSFRGRYLDEAEWLTILSRCTNLIELEISYEAPADSYEVSTDRAVDLNVIVNLSHLRSLTISDMWEFYIGNTWRRIRCPELHGLQLSYFCPWEVSLQEFEDFITNSGCALKHLHLENLYSHSVFIQILDKLSSLQSLVVQDSIHFSDEDRECFLDSLLTKLDLTATPSTVSLPNLKKLRFTAPPPRTASSLSRHTSLGLLKVLQQRRDPPEGVSKLQKVVIKKILSLDKDLDGDAIERLRELNGKGMKIAITGL